MNKDPIITIGHDLGELIKGFYFKNIISPLSYLPLSLSRQLANLGKKSDDRLTLYFHDFKEMCRRVIRKKRPKIGLSFLYDYHMTIT